MSAALLLSPPRCGAAAAAASASMAFLVASAASSSSESSSLEPLLLAIRPNCFPPAPLPVPPLAPPLVLLAVDALAALAVDALVALAGAALIGILGLAEERAAVATGGMPPPLAPALRLSCSGRSSRGDDERELLRLVPRGEPRGDAERELAPVADERKGSAAGRGEPPLVSRGDVRGDVPAGRGDVRGEPPTAGRGEPRGELLSRGELARELGREFERLVAALAGAAGGRTSALASRAGRPSPAARSTCSLKRAAARPPLAASLASLPVGDAGHDHGSVRTGAIASQSAIRVASKIEMWFEFRHAIGGFDTSS